MSVHGRPQRQNLNVIDVRETFAVVYPASWLSLQWFVLTLTYGSAWRALGNQYPLPQQCQQTTDLLAFVQKCLKTHYVGTRTVTPKRRDGLIESLRVLKVCRKTAIAARCVALQLIQNTIICVPDELREQLRKMTRMQLIRTLAAWRLDLSDYRNLVSTYRITLKWFWQNSRQA